MLTEGFPDLHDQHLRQPPVAWLAHLDPPFGRMARDVGCATSTVEGSILPQRGLLLIVPNAYFQMFYNTIIEKGLFRKWHEVSSELLLYQLLTPLLPGFDRKRNALGPPRFDARLPPMGGVQGSR
jgi:hypothetical protein